VLVEARRIRDVLSAVKVRPRPPCWLPCLPLPAPSVCPMRCVSRSYCRRTAPSCFCCLPSDSV
jgi:hypothetical protein